MGQGASRFAIYARVSTADQSPELQLRELRDYAGRRGFLVHREYVDQASGDVRRRKRAPEFDTLMADAVGAASTACWFGSTTASPAASAR